MESSERIIKFCENQKSIKMAIVNFIDWFMDYYAEEESAEQAILTQCVRQMFRKYYYSALDPEMMFTPADIVNTLCEREFGTGLMAAPFLQVASKGKRISRLQYHFQTFQVDNHPFVKDLEFFLHMAAAGIRMDSPGIPSASEYSKLKKNILIFDRHYLNMLCLIALEAGYIECKPAEEGFIAARTTKTESFLYLSNEKKLQNLIENSIALCSKTISQAFPELRKEFTIERIADFLRRPESFEQLIMSVYRKMGVDSKRLVRSLLIENFEDALQLVGFNKENTLKLFWFQNMLDIYFFTPFGYYLQLIRPVYPDIYDLEMELDEILSEIEDFQVVRNKVFSMATEYELTVLGESLLIEGEKPRRRRAIPSNIGDEEMFRAVLASADYLELEEELMNLADADADESFQLTIDEFFRTQSGGESSKGKIIEFPTKKENYLTVSGNAQVFVFKVKAFYDKRIWRQIEIKDAHASTAEAVKEAVKQSICHINLPPQVGF